MQRCSVSPMSLHSTVSHDSFVVFCGSFLRISPLNQFTNLTR